VEFFADVRKRAEGNDLSLYAHASIACFLAAAHSQMLLHLQSAQKKHTNAETLLAHWHDVMESESRVYRSKFFEAVLKRANEVSHFSSLFSHYSFISFDS
jgi:hypothetical protein